MRVTGQDIEQAIKAHIVKEYMYDKPETMFDNDLPLIQEGIIDSLGIFVLIGFIEKEFEIKVQPRDVVLENFETVNTIKNLVIARLS